MKNTELTIFAGVNGAGKSTLYRILNGNFGVRLNSDEIVQNNKWDWKDSASQLKAAKELIRLQNELLKNHESFNRETTLCGTSIVKTIETAAEQGYRIELFYVGVASPEIAIKRVREREAKGGHGVSAETIEHRYDNSQENMKMIFGLCDAVHFYDNTVSMKEICWCKGNEIRSNVTAFEWENDGNLRWLKQLISDIYGNIRIIYQN